MPADPVFSLCPQFAVISGRCLKDVVKNPEIVGAMVRYGVL